MKTVSALLVVLVAAVSGVQGVTYTLISNSNCPGHDIQTTSGTGFMDCKGLCDVREDCKSFHWNSNDCFLKDYACNLEELTNVVGASTLRKEGSLIYWMSNLDDNDKMKDLAIPGTHDTAAYRLIADVGECHDWDVQQQLSGGIRFFDIRISDGNGDEDFLLKHGDIPLGSFRLRVMEIVANFLRQRPTETIFMSIKPEDSFDVDRMEDLIVKNPDYRFYQGRVDANTKLRDVRGKIVLIKRYVQTTYSSNVGINWNQLHVQDTYQLGGNAFDVDYEAKAAIVTNHFQNAAANDLGKIWVNFASANWNGIFIALNAVVSNAAVRSFYLGTNQRVGSIVPMDYPNRSGGVIYTIINNNSK